MIIICGIEDEMIKVFDESGSMNWIDMVRICGVHL